MLLREKCDFVAPGVSVRAVNDYFAACLADGQEIQTLQIWDREKMLVRIAPEPYSCTDKRELFSLSKTFCSTAVGCAVDEGLLSPDDRVVDLFPDDLPEVVSENLAKMRVRHVLSMNCGHAKNSMPSVFNADSVPRAFLALPVEFEPGTHFTYNTGATCMLAAIVRKVTGETVFDYLNRKILVPLGIRGSVWNITRDGTNEGGCGFQASSDDIAALGRLYLNRGMWEEKRLLSEKWIDDATFPHSDNSRNGTPDWRSGYGYQIWVNAREGFRGDGAYGQLMFVLPKTGIVLAVQARVPSMQKEVDNLYDLAAHLFDDDGGAGGLNVPPFRPLEAADEPLPFTDAYYKTEPNPFGWTAVRLRNDNGVFRMETSDGRGIESFAAGKGAYEYSCPLWRYRKEKFVGSEREDLLEKVACAASYSIRNGVVAVEVRYLCDVWKETITFEETDGTLTIDFSLKQKHSPEANRLVCKKV